MPRTGGFTLLEMAVSVSIIGLLGAVVASTYDGFADVRARARAQAEAELARQAVRRFVLQHKRLPCPDLSTGGEDAREGLSGSCPGGAQMGWLPYESLGLARPAPGDRMRYAVSRGGAGADLVAPTGAAADGPGLDGVARLRDTLANAARLTTGSGRPYLTGRGSPADPEDCSHAAAYPAFAIVAPVGDRDDAASTHAGFDGVNRAMADAGAPCIASPGRAMDAGYDDVVVAESPDALLGWIAGSTR
jgi:prepilin-type N-terminal cleavage/methylation domain-containing protein